MKLILNKTKANIGMILFLLFSFAWLYRDFNNIPNVSDWLMFIILEFSVQVLYNNYKK